jgi:hypothetical protein
MSVHPVRPVVRPACFKLFVIEHQKVKLINLKSGVKNKANAPQPLSRYIPRFLTLKSGAQHGSYVNTPTIRTSTTFI